MVEPKTHLSIFDGLLTQVPAATSLPTTVEDPMYIVGTDDGLDDGDMCFVTGTRSLGIHLGGSWIFIGFTRIA